VYHVLLSLVQIRDLLRHVWQQVLIHGLRDDEHVLADDERDPTPLSREYIKKEQYRKYDTESTIVARRLVETESDRVGKRDGAS
jgi:hypothetical protein